MDGCDAGRASFSLSLFAGAVVEDRGAVPGRGGGATSAKSSASAGGDEGEGDEGYGAAEEGYDDTDEATDVASVADDVANAGAAARSVAAGSSDSPGVLLEEDSSRSWGRMGVGRTSVGSSGDGHAEATEAAGDASRVSFASSCQKSPSESVIRCSSAVSHEAYS